MEDGPSGAWISGYEQAGKVGYLSVPYTDPENDFQRGWNTKIQEMNMEVPETEETVPVFKAGDQVLVKSFYATVELDYRETYLHENRVKVTDAEGYVHYVQVRHLEKAPPYKVGKIYVDADDEGFVFGYREQDNQPSWTRLRGAHPYDYDYPTRPLRELGPEIEE